MSSILIKNGRVIDPASGLDGPADVLIRDGKIAKVGKFAASPDETIDAKGKIVTPGLIDMHVHLREPGSEEVETIASGVSAAVAGGFTTVAAMPNTDPAIDNEAAAAFYFLQAQRAGMANVYPIGTITQGRRGEELAEIGSLARAGVVGFSDDGDWVQDSRLMRRAMEYIRMFDRPVISHAEDKHLCAGGVMHEGFVSTILGLPGIPAAGEEIAVARDIKLCELTGCRLHVAHVSTAGSVDLIRRAKERGLPVTAEATAHHLTLTDEYVRTFDANYKMNPPLRTAEDVDALREGLHDGTIDCIVSDHAPHPAELKDIEFIHAAFGIIGLETLLPVVSTTVVHEGIIDWPRAVAAMTVNPAKVLGIEKGTLAVGADADVTIIDPDIEWTIDANAFRSKSRNTPFHGRPVKGRAVTVIVAGEVKSPGPVPPVDP